MTQSNSSSTAQAAHLISDHLRNYAQFLEVKAQVQDKLEALEHSGRILRYTVQERHDAVLLVLMFVPSETPRAAEYELMWELRDLSAETGVLVDAFVRTVDDASVSERQG